jgi:hypothetical protein
VLRCSLSKSVRRIDEAIRLLRRQADLEAAMRKPGGIRITEEQKLIMLRRRLADYPEATHAVVQTAHAMRKPVTAVTAQEVEAWANPSA